MFAAILRQSGCVDVASGQQRLVLDVGANSGFFTMLAAAYGCRVVAFEPHGTWASLMQLSVAANGFGDRVVIHNAVATNETAVVYDGWHAVAPPGVDTSPQPEDVARDARWWKGAGRGNRRGRGSAAQQVMRLANATVRVDAVVSNSEEVLYMKVDVEGHEPSVLSSARWLLATQRVRFLFFEATVRSDERASKITEYAAHVASLAEQHKYAFYLMQKTIKPALRRLPAGKAAAEWFVHHASEQFAKNEKSSVQLEFLAVRAGVAPPTAVAVF